MYKGFANYLFTSCILLFTFTWVSLWLSVLFSKLGINSSIGRSKKLINKNVGYNIIFCCISGEISCLDTLDSAEILKCVKYHNELFGKDRFFQVKLNLRGPGVYNSVVDCGFGPIYGVEVRPKPNSDIANLAIFIDLNNEGCIEELVTYLLSSDLNIAASSDNDKPAFELEFIACLPPSSEYEQIIFDRNIGLVVIK